MKMTLCPSCGGVLGRDCYNAADCAAITDYYLQEQHDNQEPATQANEQTKSVVTNDLPW